MGQHVDFNKGAKKIITYKYLIFNELSRIVLNKYTMLFVEYFNT